MRIHLVTLGTEGDVRPFVALGKVLCARGHRVVLATHSEFEELVTRHGLEFRAIGTSMKALLDSPEGRRWIDSTDRFFEYLRTVKVLARQLLAQSFPRAASIVDGADAVVAHSFATFVFHDAERAKIPVAYVGMVPMVESRELRPVLFPRIPAWGWLRLLMARMTLRAMTSSVADLHHLHRAQIGVPPVHEKDPLGHWARSGIPFIHVFSEALVPRPTDWPPRSVVTGFCELHEPAAAVPEGLEAFLNRGPPPVYIGFGSMTGSRTEAMGVAVGEALRQLGCRAVVATGWGGMRVAANDSVFVTERVDHNWLFPRVAAVVHHGGAGTLSAGLRAGRPTAVVPFFADQPYWGAILHALGVGPRPLPRGELDATRLAVLIRELLQNPAYATAAAAVAQKLKAEDGAAKTADAIEEWLSVKAPAA